MKDIAWLVRKLWHTTLRNKSLPLYLALPLLGVFLSTLIYGNPDIESALEIGVVNQDGTELAEDAVQYLDDLSLVRIRAVEASALNGEISSGRLDAGLIFENGFAQRLREGNPDGLQLVSVEGTQATIHVKALLDEYVGNLAAIGRVTQGKESTFNRLYMDIRNAPAALLTESVEDVSASQQMSMQSVGYLITLMMFSAMSLSATILGEKENRTYFRLLAAPVTPKAYYLSNMAVNLTFMSVQIIITLLFMKLLFRFDEGVPFWQMFTLLLLFALVAVSISLLIVASARNTATAGALQNLLIIPTCFMSGCFLPIEAMPTWIQKFAAFLPQRWLLDTFHQLQQGRDFGLMYLNIAILFAFTVLFSLLAVYLFGRNKDTRVFI